MTTATQTDKHDFLIEVTKIEFDFSGTVWEEDYETEQEWEEYQKEMNEKYKSFSVHFQDFSIPDEDEDETLEGNEDLAGCEEGYYYRQLERWIDEEIGWCLLDLEYKITKL